MPVTDGFNRHVVKYKQKNKKEVYTMFELLFAFLILFLVLKITISLGIGLVKIALGLVGFVIVIAVLPLSIALFVPFAVVFLIGAAVLALLKAILH